MNFTENENGKTLQSQWY